MDLSQEALLKLASTASLLMPETLKDSRLKPTTLLTSNPEISSKVRLYSLS